MAIRKSELLNPLTDLELEEVAGLEVWVDGKLSMGDRTVHISEDTDTKIREELVRRYRESGWNVEFINDSANGPRLKFN